MTTINACLKLLSDDERVTQLTDYMQEVLAAPSDQTQVINRLTTLHPRYDRYLPEVFKGLDADQYPALEKQVYKCRRAQLNTRKKSAFNHTDNDVSKSWSHFQMVNRSRDSDALRALLSNLDGAIEQGKLLKDCAATTVSQVVMSNGQSVIVKRYNPKSALYSLRRSVIDSRARVCWEGALQLQQLGLGTPENLALLEKRKGPWITHSYLVTDCIGGETLSDVYRKQTTPDTSSNVYREIEDILFTFPQVLIAHGDFKSTNFIVHNDRVLMIDLDSFKQHINRRVFNGTYLRDIDRFDRNWGNQPAAQALFQALTHRIRQSLKQG